MTGGFPFIKSFIFINCDRIFCWQVCELLKDSQFLNSNCSDAQVGDLSLIMICNIELKISKDGIGFVSPRSVIGLIIQLHPLNHSNTALDVKLVATGRLRIS